MSRLKLLLDRGYTVARESIKCQRCKQPTKVAWIDLTFISKENRENLILPNDVLVHCNVCYFWSRVDWTTFDTTIEEFSEWLAANDGGATIADLVNPNEWVRDHAKYILKKDEYLE